MCAGEREVLLSFVVPRATRARTCAHRGHAVISILSRSAQPEIAIEFLTAIVSVLPLRHADISRKDGATWPNGNYITSRSPRLTFVLSLRAAL